MEMNGKEEVCEVEHIHATEVEKAKLHIPTDADLAQLAELFNTFGDFTRVRIVSALMAGELCVCDISASIDMSVSAVSHQLRILRTAKIVRSRREGKQIFYSIDDEHVDQLFTIGLEHVRERSEYGL